MELQVKRLHKDAKLPTFAHDSDAGMDLYCVSEITIHLGECGRVHTGIAVSIPEEHVGLIWDKSGISHKAGLTVLGGVIDAGYHGELIIGLLNTSAQAYTFAVGDKVAQMLIQKVAHPMLREVDELANTVRGANGFGSTGK